MKFVHLHTHSHYSLLEASGTVGELLDRVKELGMDALALTEYVNMYSAVELTVEARKREMKPIIGCEMFLAPRKMDDTSNSPDNKQSSNITLLALDELGYRNLIKLVTRAHVDGNLFGTPRIDKNLLRTYSKGVLAMSGCLDGEIPKWLYKGDYTRAKTAAEEYCDIFGAENFYLELQHHPRVPEQEEANNGLKQLSKELGIPLVATADIHYIQPDDANLQDIMLCVKENRKIDETDRKTMTDFDMWVKSPEDMQETFKDVPEALENTVRIAERCNVEIETGTTWYFPNYIIESGREPDDELRVRSYEGVTWRNLDPKDPELTTRLDYELDVIKIKGYAKYFLVVGDLLREAREREILTTIRGSVAGSLTTYVLGITNVNPLEYKLPFERFLNPERPSAPDIDMDFADNRRDEIIEYSKEKYGSEKVAQIGTFGTMMARAAVRDVTRALGYPYGLGDKIAKLIPVGSQGFPMTIDRALEIETELKNAYEQDDAARRIIDFGRRIEGRVRHLGVHAAGVVIAPEPLGEFVPVQPDPKTGKFITQYDMHGVGEDGVGLLKFDFLGIRNLSILADAVKRVKKIRGIDVDIENVPLEDQKTFDMLTRGETMGLFQLGGSVMTAFLKQLKPTTIHDINAMVALYRPGPMESIPDYIARKHDPSKISYLDPRMEKILDRSFGVITYQDDVMMISIELAGYSWLEADKLRKAMGKKIPEVMAAEKEKLYKGLRAHGMSEKKTQELWHLIEPFAAYGFNKAHAASYGRVAYQTAYMKANYPLEYMSAVLTADSNDSEKIAEVIDECKRIGIDVLPPNVNESYEEFAVIRDQKTDVEFIRFGLNAIKNVGKPVAKEIVKERKSGGKFKNLSQFIERVKSKDLNKKTIEALAKVGALDDLAERNRILQNIEAIIRFSKQVHTDDHSNQESLFSTANIAPPTVRLAMVEPAKKQEKLTWEKELLGLYVSDHPTSEYAEYLDKTTTRLDELDETMVDSNIRIGGIVQSVKKIILKDQKTMMFANVENLRGKIELIVFPKKMEELSASLEPNRMVLASGRLSNKDDQFKLLAESVDALNQKEVITLKRIEATRRKYSRNSTDDTQSGIKNVGGEIHIQLARSTPPEIIEELRRAIKECPSGDTPVTLIIEEHVIRTAYSITPSQDVLDTLEKTINQQNTEGIDDQKDA